MNLAEYRQGVATYLDSAISDMNIYVHGGEFREEAVLRYARVDPALVLGVVSCTTNKDITNGPLVTVTMAAVVMTKDRPQEPADYRALVYATKVLRELMIPGQVWDLSDTTEDLSAPKNIDGRNLYSGSIDKKRIALFGIEWTQDVTITDDSEAYDDFKTFYAEYDLGPEPDGEIEAEDQIDLI